MIATETVSMLYERAAHETLEKYGSKDKTFAHAFLFGFMVGCLDDVMRSIEVKDPDLYAQIKQRAEIVLTQS